MVIERKYSRLLRIGQVACHFKSHREVLTYNVGLNTANLDAFEVVSIDVLDWPSGIYTVHLRDREDRRRGVKWVRI